MSTAQQRQRQRQQQQQMILIYRSSRLTAFVGIVGAILLGACSTISNFNGSRYEKRIEKAKKSNAEYTKKLGEITSTNMELELTIQQTQEKIDRYKPVVIPESMKK